VRTFVVVFGDECSARRGEVPMRGAFIDVCGRWPPSRRRASLATELPMHNSEESEIWCRRSTHPGRGPRPARPSSTPTPHAPPPTPPEPHD